MSSVNYRPVNEAEALVHGVFAQLEGQADPQIAELRFENQLKRFVAEDTAKDTSFRSRGRKPQRPLRPAFMVLATMVAAFLLASAAGDITLEGWDDGQQINVELPKNFTESDYVHYVALFANRSKSLAAFGGHSLIVDTVPGGDSGHMLQLSVLGVDASTANQWFRSVLEETPELKGARYQLTQPQVSYEITVREMLAYRLGQTDPVERRVVNAWTLLGEPPSPRGMIYLIAGHKDEQYPRRASMLRK
jgi:hypothetical protein